ncbi:hypothetical protein CDL15_Pgr017344 [Punica granatum]|uniref:Protein TONSOKU n=1 Tax=Punica granatum TaxID=22663 RepID=A0A218Y3I7_PUNGR|nr:hypothetical protein CDL15_Pgr017344 [Punica granatum]
MPREDAQLSSAKRAYRSAQAEGNRQEEARWANTVGNILKNRGEYVEALRWLRLDYEVTSKHLPVKQLLPTCQSLGEVYLRLEHFKDALIYQKKHLELAKDSDDLVEQQRASTQLGRTYHEMFLRSSDDHISIRNAKKYFKSAMKLVETLKHSPPTDKSSFLKEYIDAHNNIGMLELDLDNLKEAEKILTKGLEICNEEEVPEDDDGRSRLNHNLGNVYTELRKWDKAKHHIEKDIIICKRIGHCQGEAKGYINLGELHYRVQRYDDAILCYQKGLDLAKSMEDEDALVEQIEQNINIVKQAMKVMDELKSEEQNFKKLARSLAAARGTSRERKCLLEQNKSLDLLIEKSSIISAWLKHLEFAKRKKRIAVELCDKEKLSDSYLVIGESYQKLRNFVKALKWYNKSWEIYQSIGNMEGQALVKINIGTVLDCDGNWRGALNAYEEGYRIAVEANLPSIQLSALENMHYSHMIRFDNIEEARRLQLLIDKLKQSDDENLEAHNMGAECCSETDTEGDNRPTACSSPLTSTSSARETELNYVEELTDDTPLVSFLRRNNRPLKLKTTLPGEPNTLERSNAVSPSPARSSGTIVGRKRVHLVLSDDEDDAQADTECGSLQKCSAEAVGTSGGSGSHCKRSPTSVRHNSKYNINLYNPINLEESTCSYRTRSSSKVASQNGKGDISNCDDAHDVISGGSKCNFNAREDFLNKQIVAHLGPHASANKSERFITFQIDDDLVRIEAGSFLSDVNLSIESLKAQLACLYYLQLPTEKRLKGLLPIIEQLKSCGRILERLEAVEGIEDLVENGIVEVLVGGWIQKPLMKLYVGCCEDLSEAPNLKLLTRLYNLEVSEDEVIVSDCELQDVSVTPLLNALNVHGTIAMLNLSHNLLGNGTMEKLQQIFKSSGQNYGDLSLDLHCNRFGPTALFQICESPVLFARLVVLNISGNRLTDACGSYISTILKNCKALDSLNIERCSISSRTIQKVADAIEAGSMLSQLWIGHNDNISGNAIIKLLSKLSTLSRFSELSLNGLKLMKPAVDSLCQLVKTLSLSGLMLGGTSIGTDGALQLTESLLCETHELVKFDVSCCRLSSMYFSQFSTDTLLGAISDLNLGGNIINQEGATALASMLRSYQCSTRVLVLNKCKLGLSGVLQIIQALAGLIPISSCFICPSHE